VTFKAVHEHDDQARQIIGSARRNPHINGRNFLGKYRARLRCTIKARFHRNFLERHGRKGHAGRV